MRFSARWAALLVLVLTGCRSPRPTHLSDWHSCVVDRTVPEPVADSSSLSPVPGEGNTLSMTVEWGRSPVVTEYSFAELVLALPANLTKGTQIKDPAGEYKEGGQALVFQSRVLLGTIDVTEVDADHVVLAIHLTASSPSVDFENKHVYEIQGTVSAKRKASAKECPR